MDFALSEDQQMLQDAAREFAQGELAPRAAASDAAETYVAEQVALCGEMGFMGMGVPERFGGSALDAVSASLILMEINQACASTGITVSEHNSLVCGGLLQFGTDERQARYLPYLEG